MKKIYAIIMVSLVFVGTLVGQQNLKVIIDENNVVSSRLEGEWEISGVLTQRLQATTGYKFPSPIRFTSMPQVANQIPRRYVNLKGQRIYMAGMMTTAKWSRPFLLMERNGNPFLTTFVKRGHDSMGDTENYILMLVAAKNKRDDFLFIKWSVDSAFYGMGRSLSSTMADAKNDDSETNKIRKNRNRPSKWYMGRVDGRYAGYVYLLVKETDGASPVNITYRYSVKNRGMKTFQDLLIYCSDNDYLSPQKIISKGRGSGREVFPSFIAKINSNKKLITRLHGAPLETYLTGRVIYAPALLEVVSNLPFDNEQSFKFDLLEVEEFILRKNHEITYLGKENLVLEGSSKNLHKFVHKGEDYIPSYYWVSDDRALVRFILNDEKEFVLTTRKRAMGRY